MLNKKIVIALGVFFSLAVGLVFFSGAVHAQSQCPAYVPSFLCNQFYGSTGGTNGLNSLIEKIIQFIFAIAGLVVLIYIIIAGFKFITSGGDASKKEEAQKQIVAAVIGLLIIVFSFFIVQLVFSLLGVGSLQNIELPCPPGQTTLNGQACITGQAQPGS